jgi:hypothetical protein
LVDWRLWQGKGVEEPEVKEEEGEKEGGDDVS